LENAQPLVDALSRLNQLLSTLTGDGSIMLVDTLIATMETHGQANTALIQIPAPPTVLLMAFQLETGLESTESKALVMISPSDSSPKTISPEVLMLVLELT